MAECKTAQDVLDYIKENEVKIVDVKFADPLGLWHHCSFASSEIDEDAIENGLPFDGSSIRLFRNIDESDMMMVPDPSSAFLEPFTAVKTLSLTSYIKDPGAEQGYDRCPRACCMRAQKYLESTGIADTAIFGPEAEFFIFDNVQYEVTNHSAKYFLDSSECPWNSGTSYPEGNLAHRTPAKQWYFPVSPIDTHTDIRTEMLLTMGECGVPIEKHHHEVGGAQAELGFTCGPLIRCADNLMTYKHIIKNVAKKNGKSATFMPKPITGDNGSGMHVHQSLWKEGKPLFYGDGYANLSKLGLNYIGGILKHAKALTAFTNPTVNSYKRLVPGFEAPVNLVYSQSNRSAAIRIPMYHPYVPKMKRMEFRCPDPSCNPYLAFAAMLMAGIDGIQKEMDPGAPLDEDVYELSEERMAELENTPASLEEALLHLEKDHQFLLDGGVFSEEFIKAYIAFRRAEIKRVSMTPHPLEFEMYYHC